jgi:hypothetical protein
MREDMLKVLIERPRYSPLGKYKKGPKGRNAAFRRLEKVDLLPKKENLRKRWNEWQQKQFTDLFGPLLRFLAGKVGKAWNDIYSEIKKENVDSHFLRHIDDFVFQGPWIRYEPLWFYVDEEGILRKAEKKKKERAEEKKEIIWINEKEKRMVWVDEKGIWFEITLAPGYVGAWDVLQRKKIGSKIKWDYLKKKYYEDGINCFNYGILGDWYCFSKRALGKREIRKLKHVN